MPADYDACYKGYAAEGARVIALAHKLLPAESGAVELRALSRDAVESDLEFVGFAIFQVGSHARASARARGGRADAWGVGPSCPGCPRAAPR